MPDYIFRTAYTTKGDLARIPADSRAQAERILKWCLTRGKSKWFTYLGKETAKPFQLPRQEYNAALYNKQKYREYRKRDGFIVNENNIK